MRGIWWARTWPALLGIGVVLTVGAPAAVASYRHAAEVVARHDPAMAPWLPLSIDGLLVASLVAVWVRRRRGVRIGWGPWAAFAFGTVVTVLANLAAVDVVSAESVAVHLLPPITFAVALELVALVAGRAPAPVEAGTASDAEGTRTTPAPERVVPVPTPRAVGNRDDVGNVEDVDTAERSQVAEVVASDELGSRGAQPRDSGPDDRAATGGSPAVDRVGDRSSEPVVDRSTLDRLVADGAGRRRAAKELGVSEYRAAALLAAARTGRPETPAQDRSTAGEGPDLALVGAVNGAVRS